MPEQDHDQRLFSLSPPESAREYREFVETGRLPANIHPEVKKLLTEHPEKLRELLEELRNAPPGPLGFAPETRAYLILNRPPWGYQG
ncbi:MAG: hypothetical protein A2940_02285 [Candidatus Wildermuthbacteria bacterium RIFCSPLOWO2_01_FULL_48_29]|uniref:Uncharacterized protein n=2 Tax=Candidatus Wildermuthiibacteriota TaxID=1817923 RepID=A0A1G2RNC0_9BACT|nr:MAG: hypothetical protein A2843_02000 [Candidatus Wildermuthbacteria bacterium RIFCSPHIGHO2_01_FULL_48_27b]OHA73511.1 MAG: hypothetical protein A2940_02285 [Candidatus Wildermuthbacteria bacterium RIFCSPLOWO2_01_FULL_48_29]